MAGRRDSAAAVLLFLTFVCVPPARPHPALQPHPPTKTLTTTSAPGAQTTTKEGGWSLKDTLVRLDDMLQRHNDYNDVMLESGEEDDQLSRLLYKLQHGERVREGWYDTEPTLPPPPDHSHHSRKARQHRLGATALTEGVAQHSTTQDTKAKNAQKKARGGRGDRKKHRGKTYGLSHHHQGKQRRREIP